MTLQASGLTRDFANMAVTRSQSKGKGTGSRTTNPARTSPRTGQFATGTEEMTDEDTNPTEDAPSGDHPMDEDSSEEPSGSSPPDAESEEEDPDHVHSQYTNITYDISKLSQDAKIRVGQTLEPSDEHNNKMYMSYCGLRDGDGAGEFRINDAVTVIVGGRGGSATNEAARCTCGSTSPRGAVCKHIYWLEDQLMAVRPPPQDEVIEFANDGRQVRNVTPSQAIQILGGLDRIAEAREWERKAPSPTGATIRDLLTVFQPNDAIDLADAEERLMTDAPTRFTYNEKYDKVSETITHHAERDPSLGIALERLIPKAFLAKNIFDKILLRIPQIFQALRTHADSGTTTSALQYDPKTCAGKLNDLVERIHNEFKTRVTDAPDMTAAVNVAVAALLNILEEVAKWNCNVYTASPVHASRSDSPDIQANLYQMLIGSATYQPRTNDKMFAIETLKFVCAPRATRPNILHDNHANSLRRVVDAIKLQTAPQSYINALDDLVALSRKRPGEPGDPIPSGSRQRIH